MSDFPGYQMPPPPILTPFSNESLGPLLNSLSATNLNQAVTGTWQVANLAVYYPFQLTDWATAYQLGFWVGATSSGNIDVGIYDAQLNRIVSAGSTAMSATVNTVQELNITDTLLAPGDYWLAGASDNTTGTVFRSNATADEVAQSGAAFYQQAGLTAAALTNPGVPVAWTQSTIQIVAISIQFRSVF